MLVSNKEIMCKLCKAKQNVVSAIFIKHVYHFSITKTIFLYDFFTKNIEHSMQTAINEIQQVRFFFSNKSEIIAF